MNTWITQIGRVGLALAVSTVLSQAQRAESQAPSRQRDTYNYDDRQDQNQRRNRGMSRNSQGTDRAISVSAGAIAQNPNRFYGEKVRVRAEVEDVFGVGVFSLDEDRWFAGPDVLVLAPGNVTNPRDGSMVTVTGTLREFVSGEIRRDYDWFAFGWDWNDYDDVWVDWDQRPVLIADSIRTDDGRELFRPGPSGRQTAQLNRQDRPATRRPGQSQSAITVSAADLIRNPQNYIGQTVRVRSSVEESFGSHAFTLDNQRWFDGTDVLVVMPHPAGFAPEGREVTVVGTVRPFHRSQMERDYDWFTVDLFGDADELNEWERERRPVIVARSVRTDSGRELVQSSGGNRIATGGAQTQAVQRGQGGGGTETITTLGTLFRTNDPNQLVGNRVDLERAQVQRVLNRNWIMIGTYREQQILVRVPRIGDINIGDFVEVSGVIRQMPQSLNQMGLNQQQLRLAEQQDIYINANQVSLID